MRNVEPLNDETDDQYIERIITPTTDAKELLAIVRENWYAFSGDAYYRKMQDALLERIGAVLGEPT